MLQNLWHSTRLKRSRKFPMKIFRCLFTLVQICVLAIILSGVAGDCNTSFDESSTDAAFVEAEPTSGKLAADGSIVINFDNNPGEVTTNAGTVLGGGKTRTIEGPFEVGELTLAIEWTNGNGKHELEYTVVPAAKAVEAVDIVDAAEAVEAGGTVFVEADPASGKLIANDSIVISFDSNPGEVTTSAGTVLGGGKTRIIEGPFEVGELTLIIEWTNGNGKHELEYTVVPAAAFVEADPASGELVADDSIVISFDNNPGEVTTSAGTVLGGGKTRIIDGPFEVGELTLVIKWTNGSGKHKLEYTVVPANKKE